jgi:integrase
MDRHGNIAEGGKSDAATRSIIIGPSLAAMLLEHKRRGGVARWPTDLVFVNREGRPASYNATAERWRECCRAAGVSFNWHSLRHFAVTSWIAAGLPVKAVQVAAGHSSATMTLDVYSDYWPTEGHEAAFIALDAQLASPPAKGGRVDAQRGPM